MYKLGRTPCEKKNFFSKSRAKGRIWLENCTMSTWFFNFKRRENKKHTEI